MPILVLVDELGEEWKLRLCDTNGRISGLQVQLYRCVRYAAGTLLEEARDMMSRNAAIRRGLAAAVEVEHCIIS